MTVRRIRVEDADRFRALRLRALRTDAGAFASSYETEAERPADSWSTWAALCSEGVDQSMFVAEEGSDLVGLAGAFRREEDPRTMHVIAMWVDPVWRRRGLGRALTEAVASWARQADADALTLWVADGNDAALRLYEEAGFRATGETAPLRSNPEILEHRMALSLGRRLRMPDGYVELEPVDTAQARAFLEWVVADRTARIMERDGSTQTEAAAAARAEVSGRLDGPPGSSHHFFSLTGSGDEGDPRGWLWMSERRRSGTRLGFIEELVIFDEFRGRGLGAAAVDAAVDQAALMGLAAVEAAVPAGNEIALRIARMCGFVETRRTEAMVTVRLERPGAGTGGVA